MDVQILDLVYELQRTYGRVYAWHIQSRLDYDLCEQTIRRRMVALWKCGDLIRLGERKGYILARVG